MNYLEILTGQGEPMSIYQDIIICLENIEKLPYLIEQIYNGALALEDDDPDHLHFALVRLQVYADIHHYENVEETQKIKYVAQVLERVIFGSLMLEPESTIVD